MQVPKKPDDERRRLNTLLALNILDTAPEERFDRLTRLARRLFDVPIALLSLVDENRQWFKSCQGLTAAETPRDISFCGHAILDDGVFLIEDARQDQRFADNPLVTGPPHIRFYAGCSLSMPNGSRPGTLCIIDSRPRALTEGDLSLLKDLTRMAEDEMRAIYWATQDELTGLLNRRGFESLGRHSLELCRRMQHSATLMFFDLDRFKQINDNFGHAEGDRALQIYAAVLGEVFRQSDVIARISGDEFAVLGTGSGALEVESLLERLQRALLEAETRHALEYGLAYSVGWVDFDASRHDSIQKMMGEADRQMYKQKKARA